MSMPLRFLAVAGLLATGGCDLPSSPEEARDRLSRGSRDLLELRFPLPTLRLPVEELLTDPTTDLASFIDTATLSLRTELDPVTLHLRDVFGLGIPDVPAYRHVLDLTPAPFRVTVPLELEPIEVPIPEKTLSSPLGPDRDGVVTMAVDMSDLFGQATLASSSVVTLKLTTESDASLTGVTATALEEGGRVLARVAGSFDLPPGTQRSLDLPLGGHTVGGRFQLRLTYETSSGDGSPNDLVATVVFENVGITEVSGVKANFVPAVRLSEQVPLEVGDGLGDLVPGRLAEALIQSGRLAIRDFRLGTLEFIPGADFDGNLSGKSVGGSRPDSVRITGLVTAPAGAATATISTTGSVEVEVSGLALASVTLEGVEVAVDESVDWAGGGTPGAGEVSLRGGELRIDTENWLPVAGDLVLRLEGIEGGSAGQPRTIRILPGTASTPGRSTVSVDLSSTRLRPDRMRARVSGTLRGARVTFDRTQAERGLSVRPTLDVDVGSLDLGGAGGEVEVDATVPLPMEQSAVSRLADLLGGSQLEDVELVTTIQNGTGASLSLPSLELTLVDPSGRPYWDGAGQPWKARITGEGGGVLTLPAGGPTTAVAAATSLANGLLEVVRSGRTVHARVTGRARTIAGGGTITPDDSIRFSIALRGPLQLRLPPSGLRLDREQRTFAAVPADVGRALADLDASLVVGTIALEVTNAVPAGATFDLALAKTPEGTEPFSPFEAWPALVVTGARIPAPTVDADGVVLEPGRKTVEVAIPRDALDLFRAPDLGLGLDLRITPPASTPSVRLRKGDVVEIRPTVLLIVSPRAGG